MPHLISRQAALKSIRAEVTEGECIACFLLNSVHPYILDKGERTTVLLSEYPRTWGQTMVLLNSHKTLVSEVTQEEWGELMEMVRLATISIETKLKPFRCYISGLGATRNLPNTCPHIHFNILPVYNEEDTPAKIFTWQHGLYAGTEEEWKELYDLLKEQYEKI